MNLNELYWILIHTLLKQEWDRSSSDMKVGCVVVACVLVAGAIQYYRTWQSNRCLSRSQQERRRNDTPIPRKLRGRIQTAGGTLFNELDRAARKSPVNGLPRLALCRIPNENGAYAFVLYVPHNGELRHENIVLRFDVAVAMYPWGDSELTLKVIHAPSDGGEYYLEEDLGRLRTQYAQLIRYCSGDAELRQRLLSKTGWQMLITV